MVVKTKRITKRNRKSQVAKRKNKTLKGGANHMPHEHQKLKRFPTGSHTQPVAPKLSRTFFGSRKYRPITVANISSPINRMLIQPRQLKLTNGQQLETSTSYVPVSRTEYNGFSHYMGGPATKEVTTMEEV